MKKYIININHVNYELTKKDTIENICKNIGITIPTLHLGSNDISMVEVSTTNALVDARKTYIQDKMVIYTNSIKVRRYIKNNVVKLNNSLNISCNNCTVIKCPLKRLFDKYHLNVSKTNNYKLCSYYQKGIEAKILKETENHGSLQEILKNKNIHKVAIIEDSLIDKKDEILKKGFNEILTFDFVKKVKMIEECDQLLKLITRTLDGEDELLPCVIVEEDSLLETLPKHLLDNVLYKTSLIDIYNKIFEKVIGSSKVQAIYISESNYRDNGKTIQVTYDYLMNLDNVENSKIDNISKILKLENNQINYNSFISYFINIMKSKNTLDKDIYSEEYINIKVKNKAFKFANYNYSKELDSDVILVLKKQANNINTSNLVNDVDVNNLYKNYLKEPGNL